MVDDATIIDTLIRRPDTIGLLILIIVALITGRVIPRKTHNKIVEGYKKRIVEHEQLLVVARKDMEYYRDKLLAILDVGEHYIHVRNGGEDNDH